MQKKNLIIVFLLVVFVGVFVYPRVFGQTASAVGISELAAEPSKYLGKLTVNGSVGEANEVEGYFVMVDGGGCCQIPIFTPFNEEQQAALELTTLYTGKLPVAGDTVEATGVLKREGAYYMFDVDTVTRNGETLISKK